MDTASRFVVALAVAMTGATWHARGVGNERRDVALLGVVAGVPGLSSGLVATV